MENPAIIEQVIRNLAARRIKARYLGKGDNLQEYVGRIIPREATVGIGNSQTIKKAGLSEFLCARGNLVYDKTFAKSPDEAKEMKKKALLSDWYITGANALSLEGHIVNIDHSGNRVAAIAFGPEKVLIIAGVNKIAPTLEAALARARNVAAPLNARRAGFHPPCVEINQCVDCRSKERVCFQVSVTEGQCDPERMQVVLLEGEWGF